VLMKNWLTAQPQGLLLIANLKVLFVKYSQWARRVVSQCLSVSGCLHLLLSLFIGRQFERRLRRLAIFG
jgi:hypothetical protein